MPVQADIIYKSKEQVVAAMIQALMARVPDAWIEEDGNIRLFLEVIAGEHEGVYLANQLLRDNIWIQRANYAELRLHGEQYGLPIKDGAIASGLLRFQGAAGTNIPAGTEVGADIGQGEILHFFTVEDGQIPSPGIPNACTATDAAEAGNLDAGAYTYAISYATAAGETLIGLPSNTVTLTGAGKIDLTSISLGGPATLSRNIYRSLDGGDYAFVDSIPDNSTTTFQDDVDPDDLGPAPPEASTAERISLEGQGESPGTIYNVTLGAVTIVVDAPDGVIDVENTTAFTGGTDEEEMEAYRQRLLQFVRAPRTGSVADLKAWAEEIEGVESATVFPNDNLGVGTYGHSTIRLAGPNGTIPPSDVIAAVQLAVDTKDIANMTLHVTTFTANPVDVTVALTLHSGFTLEGVSPSVQDAIDKYINAQPVGGTVYTAGIYDAVFGLPGVDTLSVSAPAAPGATSTAVQKATAGTITIT